MSVPLYAASGIPEVGLIDLNSDTIEVYSEPGPGAYEKSARFGRGDQVLSATLPGLAIDANVALPPKKCMSEINPPLTSCRGRRLGEVL